jgi:hypothetical protein
MENEIVEEIWRTRKEIESEYEGNLLKIFKSMKQKTSTSKRKRYQGNLRKKQIHLA